MSDVLSAAALVLILILSVGFLLAFLHRDWFNLYLIAVAFVVAVPFVLAIKLFYILRAVVFLTIGLGEMFLKAMVKAGVFLVYSVSLTPITLLSAVPSLVGKATLKTRSRYQGLSGNRIVSSMEGLPEELRFARNLMTDIIVEYDEIDPEYDDMEAYRNQLKTVKEKGEDTLSTGESVLSISLGGLLLVSQVLKLGVFQVEIYGLTAAIVIQLGLIAVALSIFYRVSLLDFLAFDQSEEFESIREADVKLSYQRGMARMASMQQLMLLLVLGLVLSNVNRDVVDEVLRVNYDDETTIEDTVRRAWDLIRE